jgi:cytosine/adenosine deaminase-related metal-dependent hydrolase
MEPADLREFARFGRKLGLRLHTHLSETRDYVTFCREVHGTTPVEFVGRHEWLGPDVWFAHMVHATEPEIRIMGETGTGVAHCPASNCRLGSGIAPIPEYAAAGAPVSVGVDGAASNEAADMISEAHLAWFIHRARLGAGAAKVEDVVHWCSRGGAKVLGFDRVGAVAPGYAADLAVYDLRDPRYAGLHDEAVGPVACAGRPHLKYLVSNGKVVVEDDAIPGFDLADLRRRARAAVQRLVQAVR